MPAMAVPIITAVAGSLLSGVVSKMMSGGDDKGSSAPAVAAPSVMPNPDDAAAQAARRKSISDQMARRGRASTILSDTSSEKLGA